MAIHYHCRHCGAKLGSLERTSVHSDTLGLHKLTDQEREEMITYDYSGDIFITSICEDCQNALEENPDYHQYGFFIQ